MVSTTGTMGQAGDSSSASSSSVEAAATPAVSSSAPAVAQKRYSLPAPLTREIAQQAKSSVSVTRDAEPSHSSKDRDSVTTPIEAGDANAATRATSSSNGASEHDALSGSHPQPPVQRAGSFRSKTAKVAQSLG